MKCLKCQFENLDDSLYCSKCGMHLQSLKESDITLAETQFIKKELTIGSTFAGRYQVIEELGKGGMGKVYKVLDQEIGENIALKLLNPEIAADEEIIERFRNELKMARKISHKNICRMYHQSKEGETHYITMEYVRGVDLKSMIRMIEQLSPRQAISIAKQICEGLIEAHRLKVVHCDLKPQNIMIDREGNVRIMDFGVAKSLKAKGITNKELIVGTPEYMPPEQLEAKGVDHRSDIYSLGVILYEMVTGRVPFEGETPLGIAMKHKSEIPKDPRELKMQIPGDLSQVILKCLEKDKEKRYGSAKELLSILNNMEKRKLESKKVSEMKKKNSVAVLPFADLSSQHDQEYFCDGLAEELLNTLNKIEGLQVASKTSSFQFKEKGYDISDIGRKLKVQTVLEGSVRKAGKRLRITAQLVNVADGYHLWSEKYDRDLEDIFAIQDEISLAIVDKLKVKLFGEEKQKLLKRFTENLEAYNLYLKGRFFWNKRTGDGMKRAIDFFKQAIEKDPEYAMAYSGLADSYIILPYYSSFPPKEAYPKGKEAAEKALEIDNTIAEPHASLGLIKSFYDWDWVGAEQEFDKALAINPNSATAHFWYGWCFLWRARFDEGIEKMKHALELDPLSLAINCDLGMAFYITRQYNRAIEQYHKTLDIDANFSYTHLFLGGAYLQKSLYEEAFAEFQKEKELSEGFDPNVVETWIGITHSKKGNKSKAREILDKLLKASKESYVSPYHIGLLCIVLGDNDQGFEFLEKAYKEKDFWLCWLRIEPLFDSVSNYPRFKTIIKNLGLE